MTNDEKLAWLAMSGMAILEEVSLNGQDDRFRESFAVIEGPDYTPHHMRIMALILRVLTYGGAPSELWAEAARRTMFDHTMLRQKMTGTESKLGPVKSTTGTRSTA